MVNVFCDKRGSGKTKALITMANEKAQEAKGEIVYIDDDMGPCFLLDRRIRFISTEDFDDMDKSGFYGFLCGIISENYDIDTIFIDGLFNIVNSNLKDAARLFLNIEKLGAKTGVDFYINVNGNIHEAPQYMKKFISNCAPA